MREKSTREIGVGFHSRFQVLRKINGFYALLQANGSRSKFIQSFSIASKKSVSSASGTGVYSVGGSERRVSLGDTVWATRSKES